MRLFFWILTISPRNCRLIQNCLTFSLKTIQPDYLLFLLTTIITATTAIAVTAIPIPHAQLKVLVSLKGTCEGDAAAAGVTTLNDAREGDDGGGADTDGETVVEVGGKGAGIDDGEGTADGLISATNPEGTTGVSEGKAKGVAVGIGEVVGTTALPITAKVVKCGIKTVIVSLTGSILT